MDENKLTKDDAKFFMDMVGWSPDFILYKGKPYTKLLKERNSDDYIRFIGVYKDTRHVLSERELITLNKIYGVIERRSTLKSIAELLDISPERVRQLRDEAEKKIIREILATLKEDTN